MHSSVRLAIVGSLFCLLAGLSMPAFPGVVVMGTRVVFPGDQPEVTIRLDNKEGAPALVQTWLDHGEENVSPDTIKVPFTVTPPVARIDPGKGQILRVIYTGDPLPGDRESVFWFNMLDIPPKSNKADNYLQFAFRTRIKLFYRPKGLPGKAEDAMKSLHWSVESKDASYTLKATNASPYYVSFSRVVLHAGGKVYEAGGGMVAPMGQEYLAIKNLDALPPAGADVQMDAINDYGAVVPVKQLLTPVDIKVK